MLVNLKSLKQWTGYKSSSAIRNWLDQNGVRYFTTPAGEICTTEDAITAKLAEAAPKRKKYNFKPG